MSTKLLACPASERRSKTHEAQRELPRGRPPEQTQNVSHSATTALRLGIHTRAAGSHTHRCYEGLESTVPIAWHEKDTAYESVECD